MKEGAPLKLTLVHPGKSQTDTSDSFQRLAIVGVKSHVEMVSPWPGHDVHELARMQRREPTLFLWAA